MSVVTVAELRTDYAFERIAGAHLTPWHVAIAVTTSVALAWRREHPALVACVVWGLFGVQPYVTYLPNTYGVIFVGIIATYSLAVYVRTWGAAIPAVAVAMAGGLAAGAKDPDDPFGTMATAVIFIALCLVVGVVVRRQRQRAEQLAVERDRAERRADEVLAEERARIARELHDVVAHGMSIVVLQARGGLKAVDTDPETAGETFRTIERLAQECLDEMRRLLGLLRDEPTPLSPPPRLSHIGDLVDQARASGAEVSLDVTGTTAPVSAALELTAYRIVQEALTNALKHAPGSHVDVGITSGDQVLTLEVVSRGGAGPTPTTSYDGHGLVGMRERVALFGGSLHTGLRAPGEFEVRAEIPVDVSRVPAAVRADR